MCRALVCAAYHDEHLLTKAACLHNHENSSKAATVGEFMSEPKGLLSKGIRLDSPGSHGRGPTYEPTPGTLGVCDDLDQKFQYEEKNKKKLIEQIKTKLQSSMREIDETIAWTEDRANKAHPVWMTHMVTILKCKEGDVDEMRSVSKQLVANLRKIRQQLSDCNISGIRNSGHIDPGADPDNTKAERKWAVAEMYWLGEPIPLLRPWLKKRMYLLPPFFEEEIDVSRTLIHEAAHLIGLGWVKDIYEANWDKVTDSKEALDQPDAYAQWVKTVSKRVEYEALGGGKK